jgi:hypothetical protein
MDINELNSSNVPIVRVDKALNQYKDKVLFPEKLAKANEMLKNIGLPEDILARPIDTKPQ